MAIKNFPLQKLNRNHFIVGGLFLIFFVSEVSLWIATGGFPDMVEGGETHYTYLFGKNFVKYGLVKLRFLPDGATSSSEEAHPYHYIHMPTFPIFFTYILQEAGIRSLPTHIFIMIFILGLGLFYLYLTVKEYTKNEQTALFVLAVSVFSYSGVLVWGLDLFRSWTWLIIFGPLYHLGKYESGKKKFHFWIGLFFYFLMAYYEYTLVAFLTLVIFFFKVFRFYKKLSWKHLFAYIVLGTVPALLLHQVCVIWAIGFDNFLKDLSLTYAKRIGGGISSYQMNEFYVSNRVMLWPSNYPKAGLGNSLKILFYIMKGRIYHYGMTYMSVLTMFFSISTIKLLIEESFLIRRVFLAFWIKTKPFFSSLKIRNDNTKFLLVFFVATLLICLIFASYINTMHNRKEGSKPLLVFTMSIGGGILLSSLFSTILHSIKNKSKKRIIVSGVLLMLVVSLLIKVNYVDLTKRYVVRSLPGYKVLAEYKNHTFVTNFVGSIINYFTDERAIMTFFIGNNPKLAGEYICDMTCLFEKDRIISKEKYQNPDFLFITSRSYAQEVSGPEEIFRQYPLVEKGEDFWIFDLREREEE